MCNEWLRIGRARATVSCRLTGSRPPDQEPAALERHAGGATLLDRLDTLLAERPWG